MFCANCGTENGNEAGFCRNCGVAVSGAPAASAPVGGVPSAGNASQDIHTSMQEAVARIPVPTENATHYVLLGVAVSVCMWLMFRLNFFALIAIATTLYGTVYAFKSQNRAWTLLAVGSGFTTFLGLYAIVKPPVTRIVGAMLETYMNVVLLLAPLALIATIAGCVWAFRSAKYVNESQNRKGLR